jgi:hypothetical protein
MVCVYSDPMEGTPEGPQRQTVLAQSQGRVALLQDARRNRGFRSLCQRQEIALVRAQKISRPDAHLRCGLCDGLEMARRGWDGRSGFAPAGQKLQ